MRTQHRAAEYFIRFCEARIFSSPPPVPPSPDEIIEKGIGHKSTAVVYKGFMNKSKDGLILKSRMSMCERPIWRWIFMNSLVLQSKPCWSPVQPLKLITNWLKLLNISFAWWKRTRMLIAGRSAETVDDEEARDALFTCVNSIQARGSFSCSMEHQRIPPRPYESYLSLARGGQSSHCCYWSRSYIVTLYASRLRVKVVISN